jgi:hypothetical protein
MTSSLFSLSSLAGLGGLGSRLGLSPAAAASAAVGSAAATAKASFASSLGAGPPPIDWAAYNWPTSFEVAGLSFGVLHFDLEELRAKRDAAVFALARDAYRWWQLTMCLMALNFVDCIALAAVAPAAYPGINVLFSVIWSMVWAPAGMAVVYHAYKGYADNSTLSKMAAKGGCGAVAVLLAVMVLGAFGNINGLASLGSGRLQRDFAAAGASADAQQLWTGLVVVESLLWAADAAVFGWVARRVFLGPTAANAAQAVSA